MRYYYVLLVVFMSTYIKTSSPEEFNSAAERHIVVRNQTNKTIYLLIYNIDKQKAYPSGVLRDRSKVAPQRVEGHSKAFFVKSDCKKLSAFSHEKQKMVISLSSALLGYTMTPEGLECFPVVPLSGFRNKRKTHFDITEKLLASQQFGRLTVHHFNDEALQGYCYVRLSDAIEKARTH